MNLSDGYYLSAPLNFPPFTFSTAFETRKIDYIYSRSLVNMEEWKNLFNKPISKPFDVITPEERDLNQITNTALTIISQLNENNKITDKENFQINNQKDAPFKFNYKQLDAIKTTFDRIRSSKTESQARLKFGLDHDLSEGIPEQKEHSLKIYFLKRENEMVDVFARKKILGAGGFGEASHVIDLITQQDYVMKLSKLKGKSKNKTEYHRQITDITQEYIVLHKIHEKGTVPGIQAAPKMFLNLQQINSKRGYLGTLYDGNLSDLTLLNKIDYTNILDLFSPLFEGLDVIQKKGYLHGDIKPENIFFKETSGKIEAVLADFGGCEENVIPKVYTKTFTPLRSRTFILNEQIQQAQMNDTFALALSMATTVNPSFREAIYNHQALTNDKTFTDHKKIQQFINFYFYNIPPTELAIKTFLLNVIGKDSSSGMNATEALNAFNKLKSSLNNGESTKNLKRKIEEISDDTNSSTTSEDLQEIEEKKAKKDDFTSDSYFSI